MPEPDKPRFRADHVGSLLRPPELLQAREKFKAAQITAQQLAEAEDKAISDAVAMQQDIGLPLVTDGEFRREMFHRDFLEKFDNVEVTKGSITMRFHSAEGEIDQTPFAMKVTGRLNRPRPIFVDAFKYLHDVADVTPKLTIPSPTTLHFRGGRAGVDIKAYPTLEEFYHDLARVYREEVKDLADAGCRYLQIDEVNLAFLCDPVLREQVKTIGENPETLPLTYAKLINDSIASRPADMIVGLHLCRGNARGYWIAEGGYEPVADVIFNNIDVDSYFLEYDSPRAGGFEPLRHVPKGKTVVLGLVTTKSGALESKDALKRRIDEAAKYVPLQQLALSPQCGFASDSGGNKISRDEQWAKLRLVAEVAREVWG